MPLHSFIDTQKGKKKGNEKEEEEENKEENVREEEDEGGEEELAADFQMRFSPRRLRGCFHFWTGRQVGLGRAGLGIPAPPPCTPLPRGGGLSAAPLAVSVRLPHPQTGSLAPSAGALHNTWRRSHERGAGEERGRG